MIRAYLLKAILLSAVFGVISLSAQETPSEEGDLFEGFWMAQFPESEQTVYLVIKENQFASFFFGSTDDNTVYPAKWQVGKGAEQTLTVTSMTGHSFSLSRGLNAYLISWTNSENVSTSGTAISVPKAEVGKLTVSPDEAKRRNTTLANAEGFFGTWEIKQEDDSTFFIIVEDNRTAASSYADSKYGIRGLRGRWVKRGSELHIQWDSGHYSILTELPNRYESLFYAPGEALNSEKSGNKTIAARVNFRALGSWFEDYENDKADYATSVSAFRKRSKARTFYRGKWDVLDSDGTLKETLDFSRFQDIDSGREGGVDGSWRVNSDWAYITWEDGLRAVVQPIEDAFTIAIYLPEQALDGTPYKFFPLVPHDSDKITKYITYRTKASDRLREYLDEQREIAAKRRKREEGFKLWPF